MPTDPLSDALSHLHVRGAVSARMSLTAPWSFAVPRDARWAMLIVVSGAAVLRDPVLGDAELGAGDLALLTGTIDRDVVLAQPRSVDVAGPPLTPAALRHDRDGVVDLLTGGGPDGAETELVVAAYEMTPQRLNPLLAQTPPRLLLAADERGSAAGQAAALLLSELRTALPGSAALLDRLAESLLILVLCRSAARITSEQRGGWLTALADPALAPALRTLHDDPARPWTVSRLAQEAHLSRSHFAERFTAAIGCTPIAYLTRWRIALACELLDTTDKPAAAVAAEVGYRSPAAFHRAFTRGTGRTPAQHRRTEPARDKG